MPIVLCHLEGLTYEEAARRLGCPVRTVQSRLARGRQRLRDRLARHGPAPSLAVLAVDARSATVAESWKEATVTAAVHHQTGGASALVPRSVAVLTQGARRAMNMERLMKTAAVLILIGGIAAGAGMRLWAQSQPPPPASHAAAEPIQSRYQVKMAHGVTVEVIAVSSFPGPKTWWRPDGAPLETPPADPLTYPYAKHPDEELRVILVQIAGLPRDANLRWLRHVRWRVFWPQPYQGWPEGTRARGVHCLASTRSHNLRGQGPAGGWPLENRGVERRSRGQRTGRERPQVQLR